MYSAGHFFGDDHRLRAMVENMTDDQILHLGRGGHDHKKIFAAFSAAKAHAGQPTVILAQTVKGWTLGPNFEGRNATHQMKKPTVADLKGFRDRLHLPISDKELESGAPPYYHPGRNSEEIQTRTTAARGSADTSPPASYGRSRWPCRTTRRTRV